jgi:hypothetical protein
VGGLPRARDLSVLVYLALTPRPAAALAAPASSAEHRLCFPPQRALTTLHCRGILRSRVVTAHDRQDNREGNSDSKDQKIGE